MLFKKSYLVAIILISFSFFSFKADPIRRILEVLEKWSEHYPIEKVHLHLDKPYYVIGDTIWFKAYVAVGNQHQLSALSGVLNVELIDENNSVIQAIKLPVNAGLSWGDFTLADSLKSGSYRLRAYTNWMRNAGEEYYFDREIQVADYNNHSPAARDQVREEKLSVIVDVQFFPESGSLITGIFSTVAFKASDPNGKGVAVKGTISDTENHKVAEFTTAHLGMGSFSFLPESGKRYQAEVQFPDGSKKILRLPEAKDKGFVLAITDDRSGELDLEIKANAALFAELQDTEVTLIAQSGGAVLYAANSKLVSKILHARIPKSRFPSGIVQFTLFSSEGLPLNERLVFIQNKDQLTLKLTTTNAVFRPEEQVKIYIEAVNRDKSPAEGSFSVSVVNEDQVPFDEINGSTILSNLLLNADIKGYIEKPAYYFTNMSDRTRSDLDLLMLTQGYRRFEWKQLLAGNLPAVLYKPEKGIELKGQVKSILGKPVSKASVVLIAPDNSLFVQTETDEQGKFRFENLFFSDTTKVMVQAQTEKGNKNVLVELEKNSSLVTGKQRKQYQTDQNSNDWLPAHVKKGEPQHLGQQTAAIQLKEVRVTGAKLAQPHSSNIAGVGSADVVINSAEISRGGATLPDVLQRSYGLVVDAEGIYSTRGPKKYSKMRIIVDGMYMDANALSNISPSDVSSIEILRTAATLGIYGVNGDHGGIVIVNTKRGNEYDVNAKSYLPGVITPHVMGFYPRREFYVPKYKTVGKIAPVSDRRTTVYWNPNLITDPGGKASFSFFSAGAPGNYAVKIEGIDIHGNPGHQVFRYTVKDESGGK